MQKKVLSFTLAFLLCLSLLPAPAQAAEALGLSQVLLVDDLPYDGAYALEGDYIEVSRDTNGDGKTDKVGLIDSSGKEIIPVNYDTLFISDGMVIVGQNTDNNTKTGEKNTGIDKYGVLDLQGNQVVPLKYDRIENFYDGLAAVYLTAGTEGSLIQVEKELVGFIDKTGREVIPVEYTANQLNGLEVWDGTGFRYRDGFSDGLVCLFKDNPGSGRTEVILDTKGNTVLERTAQNGYCSSFSDGLALVRANGERGYIDKQGNMVIRGDYDIAHDFSEGYAVVGKKDASGKILYGAIDKQGNVVVPFEYPNMAPFHEGRALVWKRESPVKQWFGFVDTSGKLVVPMIYNSAKYYSGGLAVIGLNDDRFEEEQYRYGCIDKQGNMVIPMDYSSKFEFSNGIAYVYKGYPTYDFELVAGTNDKIRAKFRELGIPPECDCIDTAGNLVISFGDRKDNYYFYEPSFSERIGTYKKLDGKYVILRNPCYKETPQAAAPVSTPEKSQAAATQTATPTKSTVLINGKSVSFDAYSINNNNYFKLRDLAQALNGTEKQFEVTWDNGKQAINLISNKPYTAVGGELSKGDGTRKTAQLSTSGIFLDGKAVQLTAYTIKGNNYFKLRDIGEAIGFSVDWDGAKNTISINTTSGNTDEIIGYEVTEPLPQNLENNTGGGGTNLATEGKYIDYEASAKASGMNILLRSGSNFQRASSTPRSNASFTVGLTGTST